MNKNLKLKKINNNLKEQKKLSYFNDKEFLSNTKYQNLNLRSLTTISNSN